MNKFVKKAGRGCWLSIIMVIFNPVFLYAVTEHDIDYYDQSTKADIYTDSDGDKIPYRLFIPAKYDAERKYPLVLCLHGAGERGSDNKKQLVTWTAGWICDEVQKKNPCFILIPQCPSDQQWVNTPWAMGSYSTDCIPMSSQLLMVKKLLDTILETYHPIDRDRLYIMGCSMGGYGTWDMIIRYPKLFAAAIPVCGAGDTNAASKLVSLPVWAFHGDEDDIVPLSGSRDMIDAIVKAGGQKAKITIYKNVKHESFRMAWKEEKLIDWVFEQKKIRKN